VFVGDQVPLDIQGALAAGMHPVHIDVAGVGGTPEGVPCIADIAQLLALLEKM
jgi:FMN phosphatase YigB (HAD superfamily)